MWQLDFTCEHPWWLLLLLLLPWVWWFGRKSMAGLGRLRSAWVIAIRTLVIVCLVLALAEIQLVQTSDRMAVVFVLDQSRSIPEQQRKAMVEYTNEAIRQHRRDEDKAGVIVYGREAAIEIPPFDEDVELPQLVESVLDPEHTNLAAAIKLAQASLPEDSSKRIVIVSDGNENLGDALEQARAAAESGIGIDVVPIYYHARAEVSVEKLAIPSDVRQGQPFDMRVVLNNSAEATAEDSGEVSGVLRVSQTTEGQPLTLSEQRVTIGPGKHVFTLRQELEQPNFYTFEARFIPDDRRDDGMSQNNKATNFTYIRGSAQVLLIEDHLERGQYDLLVERLRSQDLEVTVRPTNQLFANLAELQPYDTVILANVPRERFESDDLIEMLVRNTEQMGAGLIMLGGPNSYGAGGWANTELEKAMPLDFQIRNPKVLPKGALALLMHASEIPEGNFWQKKIAYEALKTLGPQDYCGLVHYSGAGVTGADWLWRDQRANGMLPVGPHRQRMLALLDRMTPGDMPDFDPGLDLALQGFKTLRDAAIRHMIVISDGDPSAPSVRVMNGLVAENVTVTTVAVAAHGPAGNNLLQKIADDTGGKYYRVTNNAALPRIFQREARRVARPLVYEKEEGFGAQIHYPHEILSGIEEPLPPLTGFVMTTVKDSPLVEVAMLAPVSPDAANNTLLAAWTYGAGRAVCWTTDAGQRWTTNWAPEDWESFDQLFSQMTRWSMRPIAEQGNYTMAIEQEDGQVRVIVTALDPEDEFINFLSINGAVIGPDMSTDALELEQIAPGRYVGAFPAEGAGNYFVTLSPGVGQAPLRAGVNVAYSAEFRDRTTNDALLKTLAELTPQDGEPGVAIGTSEASSLEDWLATNVFRETLAIPKHRSPAWHYLVLLGGCLFFADVFFRRVNANFAWVPVAAARARDFVLRREGEAPKTEYLDRLRSSKAEVGQRIEQQRTAARFEPSPDIDPADAPLDEIKPESSRSEQPRAAPKAGGVSGPQAEEESYTSRLLKAKERVWKDRQ